MEFEEYSKCYVLLDEGFSKNPHCQHGPSVLFSRRGQKFYACSAYRSRHLCPFYQEVNENEVNPNKTTVKTRKRKATVKIEISPEDSKGQAQHLFSDSTLGVLLDFLIIENVGNVLCVGTPSIHQKFPGSSYLLDIDQKFEGSVQNFSRYNMCNHHFFTNHSQYLDHLKASPNLVVICDPPFGARLELLFNTFKLIEDDWRSYWSDSLGKISFIFVNPYFAEGKILKLNSNFKMSDYRVEYATHKKFKKGEKSPIRIFTTLDLSKFILPSPDYKFCSICQKYVFSNSKHCRSCESCDSRDGKKYYHCKKCQKCFKETWTHCNSCSTCHLDLANNGSCKMANSLTIPQKRKK